MWGKASIPYANRSSHAQYSIKAILPQAQALRDWWEHFFGGRCVALEYALGLGYRQYAPHHFLVVFDCSYVEQFIDSASGHSIGVFLPHSS